MTNNRINRKAYEIASAILLKYADEDIQTLADMESATYAVVTDADDLAVYEIAYDYLFNNVDDDIWLEMVHHPLTDNFFN